MNSTRFVTAATDLAHCVDRDDQLCHMRGLAMERRTPADRGAKAVLRAWSWSVRLRESCVKPATVVVRVGKPTRDSAAIEKGP